MRVKIYHEGKLVFYESYWNAWTLLNKLDNFLQAHPEILAEGFKITAKRRLKNV